MLGNPKRNWKTTLMGILTLLTVGVQASSTPEVLNQPEVITQILVGIGLIAAKDSDKSGTVAVPKE